MSVNSFNVQWVKTLLIYYSSLLEMSTGFAGKSIQFTLNIMVTFSVNVLIFNKYQGCILSVMCILCIFGHQTYMVHAYQYNRRVDSRFAPNQWETSLQSNTVSHWLGANLESVLKSVTRNTFLLCSSTTYNLTYYGRYLKLFYFDSNPSRSYLTSINQHWFR